MILQIGHTGQATALRSLSSGQSNGASSPPRSLGLSRAFYLRMHRRVITDQSGPRLTQIPVVMSVVEPLDPFPMVMTVSQ